MAVALLAATLAEFAIEVRSVCVRILLVAPSVMLVIVSVTLPVIGETAKLTLIQDSTGGHHVDWSNFQGDPKVSKSQGSKTTLEIYICLLYTSPSPRDRS